MVAGTGGVEFMATILEACGFSRVLTDPSRLTPDKTKQRFMVITGQSPFRNEAINAFNSKSNRSGDVIHTIIGTMAISEGVNFINVKNILIRPYWNNSVTEQVIARGIRANSLSWLDRIDRKVNVYRILTYFDDLDTESIEPIDKLINEKGNEISNNIDIIMYRMSEKKDILIKIVDRILKEVAFDCPLNYSRNVKQEFIDGSRDCEYTNCKYDCYKVTDKYSKSGPFIKSVGYYVDYSKPLVKVIKNKIRDHLQLYSFDTIDKMIVVLGYQQDKKAFIIAITEMVNDNEIIPNRYGQPCFMCYRHGSLYLSPILSYNKDYYFLSYYAKYPIINTVTSLRKLVIDDILNKDISKNFIKSNTEKLNLLGIETKIFIVEYLMTLALENPQIKTTVLYKHFKHRIFNIDSDTSFHTFNRITDCTSKYFDFEIGNEKGEYRCFDHKTGIFTECVDNKKTAKEIVDKSMEIYINKKLKNVRDKTLYGININCGFNIRDTESKNSSNTGLKCRTGEWSNVDKLKDLVKRKGISKFISNNDSNAKAGDLCDGIKKYLENEQRVFEWFG